MTDGIALPVCPAVEEDGISKSATDIRDPVLLKLVDGPRPQHELGAPAYALEALREVGLVRRRMVTRGHVVEAHWFLADEGGPLPPKRCDDPRLFDGIPEHGE